MGRPTRARKRDAQQGRLTYEALAELFLRTGPSQRVAGTSPYTLDHFRRFFGRRLPEPSTIVGYVRRRQKEGAAIQTINEELWSLVWMFQCAVQQGKLKQEDFPKIWFLREPATTATRPTSEFHRHPVFGAAHHSLMTPTLGGESPRAGIPPAKPPRRKVEQDDIASIRERFKNADKQPRAWWVNQLRQERYGITYHHKTIAAQLKELGIPPSSTT